MKNEVKHQLIPLGLTIIILVLFEVFATAVFPAFGIKNYRLPFNILIVLYLGFKVESPFIAIHIVVLQYFHSLFSIEGWEMGTISGILICIIIGYLKELLHFSSAFVTILVTQLFQVFWFIIMSAMLYMKMRDFGLIIEKFYRFIPESIFISLCAPIVFLILDRLWGVSSKEGMLGEEV